MRLTTTDRTKLSDVEKRLLVHVYHDKERTTPELAAGELNSTPAYARVKLNDLADAGYLTCPVPGVYDLNTNYNPGGVSPASSESFVHMFVEKCEYDLENGL